MTSIFACVLPSPLTVTLSVIPAPGRATSLVTTVDSVGVACEIVVSGAAAHGAVKPAYAGVSRIDSW